MSYKDPEKERAYQREYARKRRAADPEFRARRNANNRKHMLAKRRKIKAEIREMLGGKCEICDAGENLDVDHINGGGSKLRGSDPNAHNREIHQDLSEGLNTFEVRLLCKPCHRAHGVC